MGDTDQNMEEHMAKEGLQATLWEIISLCTNAQKHGNITPSGSQKFQE